MPHFFFSTTHKENKVKRQEMGRCPTLATLELNEEQKAIKKNKKCQNMKITAVSSTRGKS